MLNPKIQIWHLAHLGVYLLQQKEESLNQSSLPYFLPLLLVLKG